MNNTVEVAGKEILRAINDQDWAGVRRICRPDYLHHAPGVSEANVDKYIATLQIAVSAVPDMQIELQQIVTTDEYAMLRYTVHGTHTGDFHGIPPSGAPVALNVLGMVRVKDGLLAEGWYQFDARQLMHPPPAS
jgi:predicted ester cyclase